MNQEEKAFDADSEAWQACYVCRKKNGQFVLLASLKDARNEPNITGEYQQARFKWNKGQPIVDMGSFQMSIVDVDMKK